MAGAEGRVIAVIGAGVGLGHEYALVPAKAGAKVLAGELHGAREGSCSADTAVACDQVPA